MRRWSVIVAPSVWEKITAQVFYIADDSIDNALAWEARLKDAIFKLGDLPSFALDEAASERLGYAVHKLVFEGTYLIHYVLDDKAGVVRVIGFRHGARLPTRGEP